jgi:hypothetical protein
MIEAMVLTGAGRTTRYVFTFEHALEHVRENTYKWVNPISGAHEGYAVAEPVVYASTLQEQFLQQRTK